MGVTVSAFLTFGMPHLASRMVKQMRGSRLVCFDNGGDPAVLPAEGVVHLRSETNRFWAGGVNQIMREVIRLWPDADAVWVMNDDLLDVSPDVGEHLAQTLRVEGAACVSPAIDGTSHTTTQNQNTDAPREVGYIDMPAPMFSTAAWKRIGELDDKNFHGWGADIDWCLRARERGEKLVVDDCVTVRHEVGLTMLLKGVSIAREHDGNGWHERFWEKHGRDPWSCTV